MKTSKILKFAASIALVATAANADDLPYSLGTWATCSQEAAVLSVILEKARQRGVEVSLRDISAAEVDMELFINGMDVFLGTYAPEIVEHTFKTAGRDIAQAVGSNIERAGGTASVYMTEATRLSANVDECRELFAR